MATAIFPGSFDPFHDGHLWMAEYLINHGWFLNIAVTTQNREKDEPMFSVSERIEKIIEKFESSENFELKDIQFIDDGIKITLKGTDNTCKRILITNDDHRYTVDLIKKYNKRGVEIGLVLGQDQLKNLKNWKDHGSILWLIDKLIVFQREGSYRDLIDLGMSFDKKEKITVIPNKKYRNVSSTKIRNEILTKER